VLRHVATTRFVLEIPAHKLRLRPQYWLPNATAATAATQSALLILSLSLWVCLYGIVKVAFHRCSSLRLEACDCHAATAFGGNLGTCLRSFAKPNILVLVKSLM